MNFSRAVSGWLLIIVALPVFVRPVPSEAAVRLPAVISDNMVIQQGIEVPVWGWAEPNEKVSVGGFSVYSQEWSTVADANGMWMVKIGPFKAGGPSTLTIRGKNTITLKNVSAGEVWICSGQSNMEWSVRRCANADSEIAAAKYPNIRLFTVSKTPTDTPQTDCTGRWVSCSPETVPGFSAVAYYFGREIHNRLGVPVGLIQTCWGGTPAEAWTKHKVLASDPDFEPILERFDPAWNNYLKAVNEYAQKLTEWVSAGERARPEHSEIAAEPPKPRSPGGAKSPSRLYNGMIAPLLPYGIRGAIWYQGESNTDRAHQYRRLFPAMIKNWRDDWGQGDFPFYYVQLAPFRYRDEFVGAELREAQLLAMSVPNTGMAVTMDIGDVNDIHPKNKQDVGRRLSLWAMAKTYGYSDIVYSGPIYKAMKVEGGKIRLFFDHVGSGLVARGGPLTHFTIAGEEKDFFEAKAEIDGNTIVVSNDSVKKPVAVRFAWSNTAVPNLFNKEGLPASSFRTDDWPGVTVNKK